MLDVISGTKIYPKSYCVLTLFVFVFLSKDMLHLKFFILMVFFARVNWFGFDFVGFAVTQVNKMEVGGKRITELNRFHAPLIFLCNRLFLKSCKCLI